MQTSVCIYVFEVNFLRSIKRILLVIPALLLISLLITEVAANGGCPPPPLPPPCKPGRSPGYWKHNVRIHVEDGPASYSGDPHETDQTMEEYETLIQIYFYPGFTLEMANMIFQNNQYKSLWLPLANAFNAASGRAPYSG